VPLACFYAGFLLDEFLRLLHLTYTSPSTVGNNYHSRDRYNSCVGPLCGLCKTFMNHFEKITENKLNVHYSISGAKLVDLLDCLVEGDGQPKPYEHAVTLNKTECHIKAHYR
jgi:hypothetical protein